MIPNITLSFSNNNTIVLTNTSGSNVVLEFFRVKKDSTWQQYADITVPANDDITVSLLDNMYRLTNGANSIVFIVYGNILNHLKLDVTDILKGENTIQPAKYDFVSLVLLSTIFIGNTAYQNATYTDSAIELADITKIAEAIEVATKYCDNNDNTPQSKNTLWK